MTCTRCQQPITRGQQYFRTKRGPHHAECPTDRRIYESVGTLGGAAVIECPNCHLLLLGSSREAHDRWHAATDLTLERFKQLEHAAHIAEVERISRYRSGQDA